MKILIVVPRYNLDKKPDYNYTFPIGLAYISAVLKYKGYSVDCINLNHHFGPINKILTKKLNSQNYGLVCTGGNSLAFKVIESIISTAKAHKSKPKIILGGPIITSEPELIFNALAPDFGVIGEGEITILDLVKAIIEDRDLTNIKGVIFKNKENKLIITPSRGFIKKLEKIPYPDLDGLEMKETLDKSFCNLAYYKNCFDFPRAYHVLGSRGCPFNCTFCWHDTKYRARSVKDIIRELTFVVKKYKINLVFLYDDCFSTSKERVYDFCRKIKELSREVGWPIKWSCQIIVTSVDKKLLKIMKDSGCDTISYGFESYHPNVLKSMRKPITPKQINEALKATLETGIGVQAHFILGDIAETTETAKTTVNFFKKECRGQVGLGFVQPYPGSDLYKYCLKERIIKDKLCYIKNEMGPDNCIKMTPSMTDKEFKDLRKEVLESFAKCVKFVRPISVNPMDRLKNSYKITVKCPFCNKITTYQNCFIQNLWTYGFHLSCRQCHYRFFVVSAIQKLAYKHYEKIRTLRNYYKRFKKYFKIQKL